ncbi:mxaC protein [Rhodopseudomonas rhenobacensis]|uniref:MxaC protein n=1 Tax=Rhodopseudomonas rhenobacensis TaxID=87461 RepID=A0A7W7Z386_9BRAD|nr:vWA domain-containing protein [Rhodopseudomonas rhenobacensis]MBB5047139.1 mxaC protein [Rhodopseudomonas rhenobacensis]
MALALSTPAVLWLAPLALLPLIVRLHAPQPYPSLAWLGGDPLSTALEVGLRLAGALAILALLLGIGGLHLAGQTTRQIGNGAHIVLVIDRSSSMDDSFAGSRPTAEQASKSAEARRFLRSFVSNGEHDMFGVAIFSTAPLQALPLTSHREAVLAAVDAIDRPGLSETDIARGIAMALSMHDDDPSAASRAIVLVSDGAGVIDRRVQEKLRAAFRKRPINLYWVFLRTANTRGIFEPPGAGERDVPQVAPERHLHRFFESLKIPYRAFEAERPDSIGDAVAEIARLERHPIAYVERTPAKNLSRLAYAIAALALALLVAARLAEVRITAERVP